jgi:hypothetical protein
MRIRPVLLLALLIFSCDEEKKEDQTAKEDALFTKLSSSVTGISFVNQIEESQDFNVFRYRNFYNGGGVAIGDVNNDGLPDIFFTANMKENKLFLNKGGMKFEDITDTAGVAGKKPWDTGVVMVDVNGDGYLDIYVSNAGNLEGNNHDNDLYINNGDLTFTERAGEFNLARSGFSTHASFFDYDKDGDLDAYLLNNSNIPVSSLGYAADRTKKASEWDNVPEKFRGIGHLLLRNDNGKFVDVSDEAGIYGSLIAFGLGIVVSDINQDTYPDIYITNDFYERDYLYINQKDGTFSEEVKDWTSHLCLSAMGVDIADINNDGLNDIFVTDMLPEAEERTKSVMEFDTYDVFKLKQGRDFSQQFIQNTLQVNNGNNSFSEIAYFSGVARTDWSWAGLMFDMDNDGFKDIFVTNGIIHDLTEIDFVDFLANEVVQQITAKRRMIDMTSVIDKMSVTPLPNYAFRNNKDLTFQNVANDWGLGEPSFSNGCAYGDLDNDGDLDLVVNNVNMEAFVFQNNSRELTTNNYLQFQLTGDNANRFAIGASLKLYAGDEIIVQELMPSRGFQSSMDYVLTFGLGQHKKIDSLTVLWPDNKVTIMKNVDANQRIKLSQADAKKMELPRRKDPTSTLLSEVTSNRMDAHYEDAFNDFDHERLIVKQLSREGPAVAVGDLDKDGNEDVFVGGGKDQAGVVYLHKGGGKLEALPSECFQTDAGFEDTAASLFDADGDGDLDLVVGSGGNSMTEKDTYITRLYYNNGGGRFVRSKEIIPSTKNNIAVLAPHDFDLDGDVDLFVAARSVPGVYGINPQHLLLINDGKGSFTDGTERYAYDLKNAGMITQARWADIDNDEKADLVTISEWGTPMIFKNSGRRLTKWDSSLDSLHGWWTAMEIHDLDGDGDQDLILGNAGLNIPYAATNEKPMKLWINDFDENGTIEQITTTHNDGGDYPIHMRKEITTQMPILKKKNLKASDYSKRTIQQLFEGQIVDKSLVKIVNTSESILAINEGNGKFSRIELPDRVQWSCVSGISCDDVNNDGHTDLVMGGNFFELKPQFSRQDASYGHVLLGNGKLGFEWQPYTNSGLFIRDEIRHMRSFSDERGRKYLLVAVNNGTPRVFGYSGG